MDHNHQTTATSQVTGSEEEQAQLAALEAEYDEWELTLQEDRTERLLRELDVCEF